MKKVGLIFPRITTGKSLGIDKSPESIQALAGQLKKDGYKVRMFHSAANDKLFAGINDFNPNFIGISTMTPNYPEGRRIAESLKKVRPQLPIIIGGWHASGCVQAHLTGQESESLQELLNVDSPFDFVIAGEGEEVLPQLLSSLEKGAAVEAINGVSFFQKGKMRVSSAQRINDLSELALPSWEGLDVNEYKDKRSEALDLSVHFNRGCRFKCGFCATPVVYGRGVKTTPASMAFEYVKSLVERYRPQVITFTDEDFFANHKWVEKMVSFLNDNNLHSRYGVVFDTFASINDLYLLQRSGKGKLLNRMRVAGFQSFTIGIESFNANTLLKYNKERYMIRATMNREEKAAYDQASGNAKENKLVEHYYKRTQEAVNFANDHSILVVGDYILGNIDESEAEVRAGFEIFKNIQNLLVAYIPVFTPFPGTAIWREAYQSGLLPRTAKGRIDWERLNASSAALDLGYDIEALRNEMEVEFYTSDRYVRDMRAALEKSPALNGFFLGRFNYLDKMFPGDNRVKSQLLFLNS